MSEIDIEKSSKNYFSHIGKTSMEKITYLVDRKSHLDKILAGKQRPAFMQDFISQEENPDIYYIQNDTEYDNNIFSENYEAKHVSELNEQKLKYFNNVKNPCTYIENRVKKNITERHKKPKKNKKVENIEDNNESEEKDENNKKNEAEDIHKIIAKEELQKLINTGNNFSYYYHLLHHTHNDNYYIENNKNEIILGPEVNATRYNPKLEYIYKKTIYSPSFKLMYGRYDKEKLTEKLKNILDKKIKNRKEEDKKRFEKLKENIDIKTRTHNKIPKFYYSKRKELRKSNSFMYKKYLEENANSSMTFKGNKSEINENTTKDNNKSGSNNNNETVFTSNALKNINYNETITNNSNVNMNNNMVLKNAYLTVRLTNYLYDVKNKKNFRKINLINKDRFPNLFPKREGKASSVTNIFNNDKNKMISSRLNKTSNSNNSDLYIFPTTEKATNSTNCKPNSKKNKDNSYTIKAPNFNKMLGRNYLSKLNFQEEPIHPALNPNWSSVKPKCIMKVIYSHRPIQKKIINKFHGMGDEATFDINKVFYKYNDHIEPKTVNFDKMMGRSNNKEGIENNFPSFMTNLANRNSCVNFNEKSLIMNNFCEGRLKDQISSFNQQKCFNIKLKENNEINLNNNSFERNNENDASKIFGKIFGSNSTKSRKKKISIPKQDFMAISYKSGLLDGLPEFYRINLDSIKNKNKIDGITFKSYYDSSKDILSNREKKVFLIDFNKMK
jgi:hypothetical protein